MADYIDLTYLKKYKSEKILLGIAGEDTGSRVIDTDITDYGIATAESEVNTILSARYDVPLSNPSELFKSKVACLAIYYIYNKNDRIPPDVTLKKEKCIEWLDMIVAGTIDLLDSNNDPYADKFDYVKTVNPVKDATHYPEGKDGKFSMDMLNQ